MKAIIIKSQKTINFLLVLFILSSTNLFAQSNKESIVIDGDITKTFKLNAKGLLSIRNVNGNVEVESWNKNEVEVQIIERRRGRDELEVEFDSRADRLMITVFNEQSSFGWGNRNSQINIIVRVPRNIEVNAGSVNGNVVVSNIDGEVEAETTNGRVTLTDINGNVEANTTNGHIDLRNITGEINSTTTNAAIVIRNSNSDKMYIHTTNGEIRAEVVLSDNGRYDLRTTNGDIELIIPKNTKADVDITVDEDDFDTNFKELTDYIKVNSRDRRDNRRSRYNRYSRRDIHIRESINGGGATLRMRTTNGEISLRSR